MAGLARSVQASPVLPPIPHPFLTVESFLELWIGVQIYIKIFYPSEFFNDLRPRLRPHTPGPLDIFPRIPDERFVVNKLRWREAIFFYYHFFVIDRGIAHSFIEAPHHDLISGHEL